MTDATSSAAPTASTPHTPPIDAAALPTAAQRLLDRKAPAPMRQLAAKGVAPGLKPHDALAVVVLLAAADDDPAAETARATLEKLPAPLLAGALVPELAPGVLDAIAPRYVGDPITMQKVLALPQIPPSTVAAAAASASEAVCELIATNEQRLIAHPSIIEKLYMNKATRMSTADRVLELAVRHGLELTGIPAYKEAAAAIQNELICEPQDEETFDDKLFKSTEVMSRAITVDLAKEDTHALDEETGQEVVTEKVRPLHTQLAEMTTSQKIRRAMLGSATERMLLVRDPNRLVAMAAIKSPAIQDNEVVRISASPAVSEDVPA